MPNKSHFNSGLRAMVRQRRDGIKHSTAVHVKDFDKTYHEVLHYARHNTKLRLINLIIWYYKNGMSAHRYFANRHEEAIWLSKCISRKHQ